MESKTLKNDVLRFFHFNDQAPTSSAFIQQRAKIKPEAFQYILYEMNNAFPPTKQGKYTILACDGSDVSIPLPQNSDKKYASARKKRESRDHYQLRLHALFDVKSQRYMDVMIEPSKGANERAAFKTMLSRGKFDPNTIITLDRGYEEYDLFAMIDSLGLKFVCRVKDGNVGGLVKSFHLPKEGEYDYTFDRIFIMSNSKEVKDHPEIYHQVRYNKNSVFLNRENPGYKMSLRIIRVKVGDDYECLVTNLPEEEFSMSEIKRTYWLRWGIEISFRDLKYKVGLVNFHSKKMEFIEQEILARIVLYNFCQIIVQKIEIEQRSRKFIYQIETSAAIYICRSFLFLKEFQGDVEALIKKHLQPVRPGRSYARKLKYHSAVGFTYRV